MSTNNPTRVVTVEVRLSYAHVWEPNSIQGGKPKYSGALIIPKTDTTITAIEKAIDPAIDAGTAKFGGKRPNKAALKLSLRDGDTERDDEIYANSLTPPQVVDENVSPILDRSEVYAGCYARVSLSFYAFNTNRNKGVACGRGNIQKILDGEPLGAGRVSAESDVGAPADDFLN